MPKLTKTHLTVSVEEYNRFVREGEIYKLEIVPFVLTDDHKIEIRLGLQANESKPGICRRLNIPENAFNKYITDTYKTRKLADVRSQLK